MDTLDARSFVPAVRTPRRPRSLALSVLLALIFAAAVFYVARYALGYVMLGPSAAGPRTVSSGAFLFVHVAAGIVALLVGPFQLFSGIRRRLMRLHRWLGRIYLGAVGISGVAAVYMLTLPGMSLNFRLGISGLALAWFGTTTFAYIAIRRRRIELHREWMVRSYVVTSGFVFFRIILDLMMAAQLAPIREVIAAASWGCWAVPLLITEFVIQGRKVWAPAAAAPAAAVSSR